MTATPKEIKKRFNIDVPDNYPELAKQVLSKVNDSSLPKQSAIEVLVQLVKGNKVDYSRYKGISDSDLEKEIKTIISQNKGAPINALMGICMGRLKGRAEGKKVMELLKKLA